MESQEKESGVLTEPKTKYDKLTYLHILGTKRGLFAFYNIVINLQMWNFCDTTLADQFKYNYGYSTS